MKTVARVEVLVCDKCGRHASDTLTVNQWHTKRTDQHGRLIGEAHGDLCEECGRELEAFLPMRKDRPKRRRMTVTQLEDIPKKRP